MRQRALSRITLKAPYSLKMLARALHGDSGSPGHGDDQVQHDAARRDTGDAHARLGAAEMKFFLLAYGRMVRRCH